MNLNSILLSISVLLLSSCQTTKKKDTDTDVLTGGKFIDAFYSFDSDSLKAILASADSSQSEILFYQKWAECAHYKVLDRRAQVQKNDSLILFPVTVKDDLMAALEIDFNVTDTFHISFKDGAIRSIKTSSNDPASYWEAKDWVKKNRPELIHQACNTNSQEGSSPCECVLGMLKGFAELTQLKKVNKEQ